MDSKDKNSVVSVLVGGFIVILLAVTLALFLSSCSFVCDDDEDEIEVGVKKEKNHLQLDYSHIKPNHEKHHEKK